ncbi:hypothetical protein FACS189472_00820 [Alphaproteobacteria bacterium]|nr:hypothetical protein FACS189472_00820 [Alphaproteobacteria bacterium]
MKNRPISYSISCNDEKSEKIFFLKDHALIGISPFNSYFTEECMEKLFLWALNSFQKVTVFIHDEISRYTLQGIGYTEDKAIKKTKRQDVYLKHKAIRAFVANRLSEAEAENKIVCLSALVNNEKYIKFYNNYFELYKNDDFFRKGCFVTSKWVLENQDLFETINDESVNIAIQYFLAELPLYLNTPDILGIPSSLFVCKDPPSAFLKKVYEDNVLASRQQGYLTVKMDNIANEVYISNILKHVPGCVYWKDMDGVYLGCNQMEANMAGLKAPELIIGKTDYELLWKDIADDLRKTDRRIMQTKIPEEILEAPVLANNKKIIMLTKKSPLYDDSDNVIGIIGVSIDITDRKKVEEFEIRKNIYEQVAHDIRSPLAALSMLARNCKNLSEKEYIMFRNVATNIESIIYKLLNCYDDDKNEEYNMKAYILFPFSISEILDNQKYQHKDSKNISFSYSYDMSSNFVFIKGDYSEFCRMMSNLLNNSVEALEGEDGVIEVKLIEEEQQVRIHIKDNGKGMPKEMVDKLMSNIPVGSTKAGGRGIGTQQIVSTLREMNGKMRIESTENVGTEITISFYKSDYPDWFTDKIVLHKGDIVVVLDDDSSIHSVWENRLKEYSNDITIKYFIHSSDAIDYINSSKQKDRIFLLTDYELRDQKINGIDVIEKCEIQRRSVLVTSVYISRIGDFSEKFKFTRLLPKAYIDNISIVVERNVWLP